MGIDIDNEIKRFIKLKTYPPISKPLDILLCELVLFIYEEHKVSLVITDIESIRPSLDEYVKEENQKKASILYRQLRSCIDVN